MASEALRISSPIAASLFLFPSSLSRLRSSKHCPDSVSRISFSRRTTTLKFPAGISSIRCSGSPNQTLRTCKNCKTQFDPLLNHPQACRFHTAHFGACARNGDHMEVFDLFKGMQMSKTLPDKYTVMSLLSICSKLNSLALASSVHGFIIKNEVRCCDVFVCNVLIDMYSKCGSFGSAVKVFNQMRERNLISWTALISALGIHGYAHEALKSFREMELLGFKPDKVAFIAVLSACRHGGLVEEGMKLFRCMKQMYGVEPEMDHYECVVDLLSRFGYLQEAGQLISRMPFQPNAIIWRSFLAGCNRFNHTDEQVVGQENKLGPS
ncbi:pentatricopeptide repeat-containing protein At3g58590-like [Telopea speciosissima]|uniref:pentatricopeptide repeat-containing protein At3g58590-like n=1 Tax=Telopea speciosissima TaxID=54955 RepID=UPI001CC57C26|nr:pentatricopeptide repeat-containing protein At3g58590-like [Telopea speciosissima]